MVLRWNLYLCCRDLQTCTDVSFVPMITANYWVWAGEIFSCHLNMLELKAVDECLRYLHFWISGHLSAIPSESEFLMVIHLMTFIHQDLWYGKLVTSYHQLGKPSHCRPRCSVGCASNWWSGGCRLDPHWVGNILSWRLIMKYFLRSFSLFCWFKKGNCQFQAKECAQYWLTA